MNYNYIARMEHLTLAQIQSILASHEARAQSLKAAHQRFVEKHVEAGTFIARKAEYNRRYQEKLKAKREAAKIAEKPEEA